jgi:hypothetical protein
VVWVRKKLAGFIQPAPGFGGLQVKPAPSIGGLQVKPAPEPATKGGPAAGGRKIRVLPEAGAVPFPIFSELQIEPALCKNTHIQ